MKKIIKCPNFEITINLFGDSGSLVSNILEEGDRADPALESLIAAVDVVESMVLAHAIAGIPVESPAYVAGLEQAINQAFERHS